MARILHHTHADMDASTGRSAENESIWRLEGLGAIRTGDRPRRAHDYVFVAERDKGRCAFMIGRELRDDWEERSDEELAAAPRILASVDQSFLPLPEGPSTERLRHFEQGFLETVTRSQEELRRGAKQRTGEAPSLTLTLGYVDGPCLYLGHIGDDRCYVFRGQKLHQMTTDHALISPSSDRALVSDPMLSRKPLSFIGGFSEDLEIETLAVDLETDDILFFCTPGLTAFTSDRAIEEVLSKTSRDRTLALEVVADAIFDLLPQPQASDRAIALARFRSSTEA